MHNKEDMMAFNPFKEQGIPIENQTKSWSELNIKPFDKNKVHPYTRVRVILMNGIEVEAAIFSHQFSRHTYDAHTKQMLALTRRLEQQQQKMINWLNPGSQSILETTIGYEQVAVDLTAALAQNERDENVKQTLNFALLEDFDHLFRFANFLKLTKDIKAEKITGRNTEITVGRPTILHHRHPLDGIRHHYETQTADPLTCIHALTITAAEQQTMNYYMNQGANIRERLGRALYQEIAQVEEEHVSMYESLLDPKDSWYMQMVLHEITECWLYFSLYMDETDDRLKKFWEENLMMEVEHLKKANELMQMHEKRDAGEIFPNGLPEPLLEFKPNIDYVRDILNNQAHLTAKNGDFVPMDSLDKDDRFFKYQSIVNAGGVPSEDVIKKLMSEEGRDYRLELAGENPIPEYRHRELAGAHR